MSIEIATIREELRGEMKEMRLAMIEMAKSMSDLAQATVRYEERASAQSDRIERLEEVQRDQGGVIRKTEMDLHSVTATTKRISWIATTATGSFIAGAMGFMFYLAQLLVKP